MNPRVTSVVPTNDYRLRLTFTNGAVGEFDCRRLLDFGVFRELKDTDYFMRASVLHGTVVWPNEQDICPDTLYEESVPIAVRSADNSHPPEPAVGPVSNGKASQPTQ
ncbi:MAG: DUF2442 domain-containing protein [Planctomycetales bacterium]